MTLGESIHEERMLLIWCVGTLGRSLYTMKSGVAIGPIATRTAFFSDLSDRSRHC